MEKRRPRHAPIDGRAAYKSRAFKIWCEMRTRCLYGRGNQKTYKYYGGRGIKVCKRWSSFQNFVDDMGHPPAGLTLERINNDGNYEPGNCRWATRKEQASNRRSNVLVTFAGETKTITQWSEIVGIKRETLRDRMNRGWPVSRLLTRSPEHYKQRGK